MRTIEFKREYMVCCRGGERLGIFNCCGDPFDFEGSLEEIESHIKDYGKNPDDDNLPNELKTPWQKQGSAELRFEELHLTTALKVRSRHPFEEDKVYRINRIVHAMNLSHGNITSFLKMILEEMDKEILKVLIPSLHKAIDYMREKTYGMCYLPKETEAETVTKAFWKAIESFKDLEFLLDYDREYVNILGHGEYNEYFEKDLDNMKRLCYNRFYELRYYPKDEDEPNIQAKQIWYLHNHYPDAARYMELWARRMMSKGEHPMF